MFIAVCIFSKKGTKKQRDTYGNKIKEVLLNHKQLRKNEESKDTEFCNKMEIILNFFNIDLINQNSNSKLLVRVGSSVTSTKNVLKPINIFNSPKRNSSQIVKFVKKTSSKGNISNFQKYIKNVK